MNKKYLMGFIACAALTVTSCSNDEVMDAALQQEAKAIQFSTYLGRDVETKGAELTTDGLQGADKGFGITAYYSGNGNWLSHKGFAIPNFMYNQQVKYNASENKWEYAPIKYWPTTSNDKISFFAYAPYNDSKFTISGKGNTGAPIITVNQGVDVETMVDFVAVAMLDVVKPNDNTVSLHLKHEMSRLNLQAKVDKAVYDNTDANKTFVNIKSVVLEGTGEEGANFYTSGKYKFADTNNEAGSWTGSTNDATLDLNNIMNKVAVKIEGASGEGDYYNKAGIQGIKLEGETGVELLQNGQYLFLIPASAATGESATGLKSNAATATIAYDIVTEDSNLNNGYSCTSATKTVNLPAGMLKQGKAYTMTFTINVDEIKVSATVGEWTDDTSSITQPTVDYNSTDVTP